MVLPLTYNDFQRFVGLPRLYVTLALGITLPVIKTFPPIVALPVVERVVNAPLFALLAPIAPVR